MTVTISVTFTIITITNITTMITIPITTIITSSRTINFLVGMERKTESTKP